MSSSDRIITLELRQENADKVNNNGDWRNTLNKPITIEEGDSITVTNSFLDTTSQTDATVNLPDDINIEWEFIPWVNNIFKDGKTDPNNVVLDGMKHIPCLKTTHGGGGAPGFSVVQSVVFAINTPFGDANFGGLTVTFQYLDLTETQKNVSIYFPTGLQAPAQIPVGVIAKDGSFVLLPGEDAILNQDQYNADWSPVPLTQAEVDYAKASFDSNLEGYVLLPVTNPASFTPVKFRKIITIPAGIYAPDLFAQTITKLMTLNLQSSLNEENPTGVSNALLTGSNTFTVETFVNAESSFVKQKGTPISLGFTYDSALARAVWVGTNQFDLSFDAELNRYVLVTMHMPIYVNGEKVAVQYTTATDSVFPALAYSGICITGINATIRKTSKVIPNFAYDVLGLEVGKLTPPITYVDATVLDEPFSLVPNFDFQSGVNFTAAFNGIDLRINKDIGDTASADISKFANINFTDSLVSVVGDESDSIFGDNIFAGGKYSFGYYKIEINSGFKNLMIGDETIQRNIMGIVSKYYESSSYTDGLEGIPYIHKGAPIQLSSLGVRILKSDNTLSDTLGEDNTVFIRITKAQPVATAPTNIPEKKPA